MTWYTASLISTLIIDESEQDHYLVFENFYLVEGDTDEEAWKKAERIGLEDQKFDKGLRYMGKPAKSKFLGIRKLKSIYTS